MNLLIDAMQNMLTDRETPGQAHAEQHFIEVLTFSSFSEIVAMLDQALADDWLGFPVWARNLAFRLVCLLNPDDPYIRQRAAADLRAFGPDWDGEADRLEQEAKQISVLQRI